jgi:hypothetical protein
MLLDVLSCTSASYIACMLSCAMLYGDPLLTIIVWSFKKSKPALLRESHFAASIEFIHLAPPELGRFCLASFVKRAITSSRFAGAPRCKPKAHSIRLIALSNAARMREPLSRISGPSKPNVLSFIACHLPPRPLLATWTTEKRPCQPVKHLLIVRETNKLENPTNDV